MDDREPDLNELNERHRERLRDGQERHRRRLVLMRAEGDIHRQEVRLHVLWGIVLVLGFIALILSAL